MENIVVKLQLASGDRKEAVLSLLHKGSVFSLTFDENLLGLHEFCGSDLQESFAKLRVWLEERNIRILCHGARKDVHSSGMSRSMGGGRKSYVLTLGSPAKRTDLVDIFDFTDSDQIGSVEEQKDFYSKWASSLRNL